MKKTEEVNDLLDWYESLLTDKQLNIMDMYYREDFSITEISENLEISRSAVNDAIKKSEKLLKDYESKLNLVSKSYKRYNIYDKLKNINEDTKELVRQLENID